MEDVARLMTARASEHRKIHTKPNALERMRHKVVRVIGEDEDEDR